MTERSFAEMERAGWSDPGCAANYADGLGQTAAQAVEPMLAAAGLDGPSDVLDLCSGPGHLSAALVAAGHRVRALDLSPEMVARTAAAAPEADVAMGDATALPHEDASLDAVFISHGLMHVAEPEQALSEIGRVLRPGGRLVISLWHGPEQSEAFGILMGEIETHAEPVQLPDAHDFFHFNNGEVLRDALAEAGLEWLGTETAATVLRLDAPEAFYRVFREGTVRLRAVLEAQGEDATAALQWAMAQQVRLNHPQGDGYAVPMPTLIATARKLEGSVDG